MTYSDEKTIGLSGAILGSALLLLNFDFDPNWWIVGVLLVVIFFGILFACLRFRKNYTPIPAFYLTGTFLYLCLTLGFSYMALVVITRLWDVRVALAVVPFWLGGLIFVFRAVSRTRPSVQERNNQGKITLVALIGTVFGGFLIRPGSQGQGVHWLFLFMNTSLTLWMFAIASLCIKKRKEIGSQSDCC